MLLVSVLGISWYLYQGLQHALAKETITFLTEETKLLSSFISHNHDQRNMIIHELNQRTTFSKGNHELYYGLFDAEGNILAKSDSFVEDVNSIRMLVTEYATIGYQADPQETLRISAGPDYGGGKVQLVSVPVFSDTRVLYFLQIGMNVTHSEHVLAKYRSTIILALPIVFLVAACGGYILVWHYLRPIVQITRAAKNITFSAASEVDMYVPETHTGDEFDTLAQTFNTVFKRLFDAYRKIVQFTADVSHELRIPVTTLKGEAQVVLSRERDINEYQRVLVSSVEEYDRLMQMLNDLLVLSRSDMGEEQLVFETVDVGDVVTRLCEFLDVLARDKGITLTCDVQGKCCVRGNKLMLERLFSNIIDNAIKYTQREVPVAVSVGIQKGHVHVCVKDLGIGIPADALPHVYDRFYKVDKARSREIGGMGLGLSISHMIVKAHRGTITIQSEEGKGTDVCVALPMVL